MPRVILLRSNHSPMTASVETQCIASLHKTITVIGRNHCYTRQSLVGTRLAARSEQAKAEDVFGNLARYLLCNE